MDPIAGPGPGLPGPPAAGRARIADHAIGGGPLAHIDSAVDAGALHAEYGVDAAKPLQREGIPGFAADVVVDGEEDRCTLATTGRGMQLPAGFSVGDAAGVSAGEVRGRCPTRLAVLIVADDDQPCGGERLGVRPGDGFSPEVGSGTRQRNVVDDAGVARSPDVRRGNLAHGVIDQHGSGRRCLGRADVCCCSAQPGQCRHGGRVADGVAPRNRLRLSNGRTFRRILHRVMLPMGLLLTIEPAPVVGERTVW